MRSGARVRRFRLDRLIPFAGRGRILRHPVPSVDLGNRNIRRLLPLEPKRYTKVFNECQPVLGTPLVGFLTVHRPKICRMNLALLHSMEGSLPLQNLTFMGVGSTF